MNEAKKLASALLVFLVTCWTLAAQSEKQIPLLEPGRPVESELAPGQAHAYRVELGEGQYLHAVVIQMGIDAAVLAFGPDGKRVAEVDSPNGREGPEPIYLVAGVAGFFRIEVRGIEKGAPPGRYSIRIEEVRPATPQDRGRIQQLEQQQLVARLAAEGDALRAQQTAESWRASLEKYQAALEIFRMLGDRRNQAITLERIGGVCLKLGEHRRAQQVMAEAAALTRSIGEMVGLEISLNTLGNAHEALQEYGKALACYEEALQVARTSGNRAGEAKSLSNIGTLYSIVGERGKARESYESALKAARAAKDGFGEAILLQNIATQNSVEGNAGLAVQSYLLVLERLKDLKTPDIRTTEMTVLGNLGLAQLMLGDHLKARESIEKALASARAMGNLPAEAHFLDSLAAIHRVLGDREPAIELLTESLRISRLVGSVGGEAQALWGLGVMEQIRGNLEQARFYMEGALKLVESVRAGILRVDFRTSFGESARRFYGGYVNLLMQLHRSSPGSGYDRLALEACERGRARILVEMLAEARADIRQGVDASLLQQERRLARQIGDKVDMRMRLAGGPKMEERVGALSREIDALDNELQKVEAEIRAKSSRYAALVQPEPLRFDQIQGEVLDRDTILLEYSLHSRTSHLWAVTAERAECFEIPDGQEIETAARKVLEQLTARSRTIAGENESQNRSRIRRADEQYPASAAALSAMILKPAARLLKGKRLLVVADGALQYVPFGALPDPAAGPSGSVPLIAGHEIINLPSASVMARIRVETTGRQPAGRAVAILADPVFDAADPRVQGPAAGRAAAAGVRLDGNLHRAAVEAGAATADFRLPRLPFTRQEADRIYALANPSQALYMVDFRASLVTATSPDLGRYRMVHFATHGLLNSDNPALGGLVLSLFDEEGNPQNGFLKLQDVYNLSLPAELVVLSACQTGLGKEIKGEGLVGLTRGFFYAGARRVVASMWKVDDVATADLMERFYRGALRDRLRPAAALRQAQLAMARQKRWSFPYYWAAFILQGEWR
jgi:CHAT domain-containing protein/tetratricopeptide (TPR) repeat protein